MLTIMSPSDTFKSELVDGIVDKMGRMVTLVAAKEVSKVTDFSDDDPFLSESKGHPTLEKYKGIEYKALVRWKTSNKKMYRPEGQYMEGDCELVFVYTEDLNLLLQRIRYIVVDNKQCLIDKYFSKGSPLNRIYVILKEEKSLLGHRLG